MSWFSRLRTFAEGEDVLADAFETEFDGIAEALNSVAAAGAVTSAGSPTLEGTITATTDVPGASKGLTLARPSLVVVTSVFDAELTSAGASVGKSYLLGKLNIDGADQSRTAAIGVGVDTHVQASVAVSHALTLGAGAHTLKLRATMNVDTGPACFFKLWQAHFTYLVLPNPEP